IFALALLKRRTSCSRACTRRFKVTISARYPPTAFFRAMVSPRTSLRATREISLFRTDAMFGMASIVQRRDPPLCRGGPTWPKFGLLRGPERWPALRGVGGGISVGEARPNRQPSDMALNLRRFQHALTPAAGGK